jgi:radical SAM protein with 4Fe4S-binding SPASM domain
MDKPQVVVTELTNNCILKCSFCPRQTVGTPVGFMDFDLFKKIVDEASEWGVSRIIFDKDGDPLLSPYLIKCLEYIRSKPKPMMVSFNTPAVHMSKTIMTRLLELGLDKICFSVIASYPSTYKKITGNDKLPQVESNVREFIKLKNKMGSHTFVVVKMVCVNGITKKEMDAFTKKWKIMGVNRIAVDKYFDWHNLYDKKELVPKTNNQKVCLEPFTSMNVNWDGTVSICCLDAKKEHIVGDVNTQTLNDIWEGDKIQDYRQKIISKATDDLEPCKYCNRCVV